MEVSGHHIGSQVGLRARLDVVEKSLLPLPGSEPQIIQSVAITIRTMQSQPLNMWVVKLLTEIINIELSQVFVLL
jgi:hypothetical protein